MTKIESYWWDIIGTAEDPELTGFLLHDHGAAGMDWSAPDELHCYFYGTEAERREFIEAAKVTGFTALHVERLPIMDWRASAEHDWRSMNVGEILLSPLVEPEGGKPLQPSVPLEFFIHPASGFGTGHHVTTRATLDLLLTLKGERVQSVLDCGTGSGVLALVASRMFGADAVGIDKDEIALTFARRNVEYNGLAGKISLSTTPIEDLTGVFQLILSNVYSEYHERNEPEYNRLLEPNGYLIMSGIARETRAELEENFRPRWSLLRSREDGRWITSLYRKN